MGASVALLACAEKQADSGAAPSAVASLPVATAAPPPVIPGGSPSVARCEIGSDSTAIRASGGLVTRHGDTLSFPLPGGRTVTRIDSHVDTFEQAATFRYCGRLGVPNGPASFHVLNVQLYESGFVEIINASTGDSLGFGDVPVLSPDGSHLAVAEGEGDPCESTNRLDVWRVTSGLPRREWSVEPSGCERSPGWSPREIEWRSRDSLSFRAAIYLGDPRSDASTRRDSTQRWLVRGTAGWMLDSLSAATSARAPIAGPS
jgi:hypothetical protein